MQCISLRLVQKDSYKSFEPTVNRVLSSQNPFDCLMLGEGSRYCKVALASYTWMLHLWNNPCTGCCELTADSIYRTCTCHPRCCRSNDSHNIIGGDTCGWKQAAVLKSLGIDESNLLYANFSNGVGVNPYLIIRDDRWKTLVITVRGTLSFEDMITDVTVTPKSLGDVGEKFGFDGKDEYCHSGILAGACWIHDDLMRHRILDDAMKSHPDFGLRIIGHSLGAGVAAMLGRILKQQYPKLFCLCFSPPGCVFSERTAEESKDYVCSYVLHNDIVPRLSYDSLVNFRNDLVEMISRMKCPKHQVFDANFMPSNESSLLSFSAKHLHSKEEIPPSLFYSKFEVFKSRQNGRQRVRMTLPGRILRMVRISEKLNNVPCWPLPALAKCIISCGINHQTKKYKIVWIDAKDLTEIYISPTMIGDHFPYNVERALNVAAESFGLADQGNLRKEDELESILREAKKDKDN
jgi:sn1-specific diacylglycerol lipase